MFHIYLISTCNERNYMHLFVSKRIKEIICNLKHNDKESCLYVNIEESYPVLMVVTISN